MIGAISYQTVIQCFTNHSYNLLATLCPDFKIPRFLDFSFTLTDLWLEANSAENKSKKDLQLKVVQQGPSGTCNCRSTLL